LEKEMRTLAKKMEFEKAAKMRDQVFALKHIQDVALVTAENLEEKLPPKRIEAYDIANISGQFAVGSMVVFSDGLLDKSQYRKFKIKTVSGANDIAMLKEVLSRRLNHPEWPFPELILVDGGRGQVNAFLEILLEHKINIPVVGIAKGQDRKGGEIVGIKNLDFDKIYLLRLRDEAHRFANAYYRTLHRKSLK
jgi:excinuclease ABC subunit C